MNEVDIDALVTAIHLGKKFETPVYVKCPACGRTFELDVDRDFYTCTYCGYEVLSKRVEKNHTTNDVDNIFDPDIKTETKAKDNLKKAAMTLFQVAVIGAMILACITALSMLGIFTPLLPWY